MATARRSLAASAFGRAADNAAAVGAGRGRMMAGLNAAERERSTFAACAKGDISYREKGTQVLDRSMQSAVVRRVLALKAA